jgi:L-iditol 2-dehydrogenase
MNRQPAVVQHARRPQAVELREVSVPDIEADEVLLQVGAVSVCGSDVHQYWNTQSWRVNVPVVLGHEFCGTVTRLGRDVSGLREGDRVVSETAARICGACAMCRTGRYQLCPTRQGFGYGVDGAMTEFVRVPARCLHAIPLRLPFDVACLAEPHAVAYNAMCVNSTIRPGDAVVVLGPGPIGLVCARMAALAGAHPLVVAGLATDAARLDTAKRLGATHVIDIEHPHADEMIAETLPDGADLVCDATGASRAIDQALRLARPGGQVTKVGWSPETYAPDLNPLVLKNVRLQGSFSHNFPVWERVVSLLSAGLTLPQEIVGLRVPLGRWREAFDAMHERRVIKSVLLPGPPDRLPES